MKLTNEEKRVAEAALRLAAMSHKNDMAVMVETASKLREGHPVPPFMDGERGAVVADRLVDQFRRQAREAEKLLTKMEGAEEIRV